MKIAPFLVDGIYEKDKYRCYLCGAAVYHTSTNKKKRVKRAERISVQGTIDHVIPKSRGGTNAARNLRPTCRPCNSAKSDRSYTEMLLGYELPKFGIPNNYHAQATGGQPEADVKEAAR